MIIYPTIELQNGRCVSLHRGRMEEPQVWHVDPVARAREYAEAGAEWIHVTDFDAIDGDPRNVDLVREIMQVGPPVQLGGGFRSLEAIETWIDMGVGRVVVSTLALRDPNAVKLAARRRPDQVVLAVDVFQGRIMADGWRAESAFVPADFIRAFGADPLAAIIVTDIDADIEETEAPLALITELAALANAPVIARGTVRTLDDLARLKYVPHVAGAIIGRALLSKDIDLGEALALAAEAAPVAPFSA